MLHRALFGSLERFIGILIENYSGKLPFWLCPIQTIVIPISSDFDDYAKQVNIQLKKIGLKIKVYNEKDLKKLGMGALLGVGQGSVRGSYLVTMEWNGNKSKNKPLAFVGKGVCFDTGGYSLKPAKFMEDMTYDMAGSATVVGLMKSLALRKAKVNAVGVVGLVENMPGGNAQRPGDIVKSYSGKTVEILNTDAEGRLVLADLLSWAEKNIKPALMIDLATLTGAMIVSLGKVRAGLFCNNNNLAKKIETELARRGHQCVRRSTGEKITTDTTIYIADTLGELGLFYRLARIAFIGGSMARHGGHNPLEAAQLGCAIVQGPDMVNFQGVADALLADGGAVTVHDAKDLASVVGQMFEDRELWLERTKAAEMVAKGNSDVIDRVCDVIKPIVMSALRNEIDADA